MLNLLASSSYVAKPSCNSDQRTRLKKQASFSPERVNEQEHICGPQAGGARAQSVPAVPVPSAAGAPAGASAGAATAERRMPNTATLRATPPSSTSVVYRAGRQWHVVVACSLLPRLLLDLRLNDDEEG